MTKLVALAGAFAVAAALQLGPVGLAWGQDDAAADSGTVEDVGQASPSGAPQAYKRPMGLRVRGVATVMLLTKRPGAIETTITKEDGSKAVGKKFAPKGTAQPGAADVVREEDMPRNFRVIPPKKGVAGITHN